MGALDSESIEWNFVEDPEDQSSSDDDWYSLCNGYIEPEAVLADEEQITMVREAEAVLASFFAALYEADIRIEM